MLLLKHLKRDPPPTGLAAERFHTEIWLEPGRRSATFAGEPWLQADLAQIEIIVEIAELG